ncbi:peptidyl-prolyl cis-trans isomerase CYP23 [Primulina eburnea]|uniref:peptidyl-prolyl cis-trans isomerase CYP23 n=1 Tax=Primulina eburnea TaxID=1245227 RepID=UPI003C6C8D19
MVKCTSPIAVKLAVRPSEIRRQKSTKMCGGGSSMAVIAFFSLLLGGAIRGAVAAAPEMGSARVVFQTNYGDIEFGFYPSVAPKTVEHIFKLVRLGCYNTNHFFRVDKGFVAQVADVGGGRSAPMNEEQKLVADKTLIGEFSDVKHVRGILSMGRYFPFKKIFCKHLTFI